MNYTSKPQRCMLIGFDKLDQVYNYRVRQEMKHLGYVVYIPGKDIVLDKNFHKRIKKYDLALGLVNHDHEVTRYALRAVQEAPLPTILLTTNNKIPEKYHDRLIPINQVEEGICKIRKLVLLHELQTQSDEYLLAHIVYPGGQYSDPTNAKITVNMNDIYNIYNGNQQIGSIGAGATAQKLSFRQDLAQYSSDANLEKLAKELAQLRDVLHKLARTTDQKSSALAVKIAEKYARKGDAPKTRQWLGKAAKDAGKWTLKVATEIGTNIVSEFLKNKLCINA